VFDKPVIGRCQIHKLMNVRDHLPKKMRGPVENRLRAAYHADSALEADALRTALAKELDKTHPEDVVLVEHVDSILARGGHEPHVALPPPAGGAPPLGQQSEPPVAVPQHLNGGSSQPR
jgi:hypothetical protein